MPKYRVQAANKETGASKNFSIEADSEAHAVEKLSDGGWVAGQIYSLSDPSEGRAVKLPTQDIKPAQRVDAMRVVGYVVQVIGAIFVLLSVIVPVVMSLAGAAQDSIGGGVVSGLFGLIVFGLGTFVYGLIVLAVGQAIVGFAGLLEDVRDIRNRG